MKDLPYSLFTVRLSCALTSVLSLVVSTAFSQTSVLSEAKEAHESLLAASKFIESRLSKLKETDFSSDAAGVESSYRGFPMSRETSQLQRLRNDLRAAFAEIKLGQVVNTSEPDGETILSIITDGKDFFGAKGSDPSAFAERFRLLDKLIADPELQFSDRLFLVLKRSHTENHSITLARWIERTKTFLGENYLGNPERMGPYQQAKTLRSLYLFGCVLKSKYIRDVSDENPVIFNALQDLVTHQLGTSIRTYARKRFEEDGALRDRSLPILKVAQSFSPDLTEESVGVTDQLTFLRFAIAHARGLASLIQAIDAPMADTHLARKSIGQIIDYRVQSFYIGSEEVREKGTLPCKANHELDLVLSKAEFFGKDGHTDAEIYKKRVQILEQLFMRPSSEETRDFLFALKTPQGWLSYFHQTLVETSDLTKPSCLQSIQSGGITPLNLKNLFLARCILSHEAFDANAELSTDLELLKSRILEKAPLLAIKYFKEKPEQWNKVDIAFQEISKLVPQFEYASLGIPTFKDYVAQKKDYDWALTSIPLDFASLADPDSPNMLDNEVELFESDFVYRTGKFDRRLSPVFTKELNHKLEILLSYRNSQFTPPDTRERPGFKSGPILELAVINHHHSELAPGNPQLHDLLEGPNGGFGGLGQLFFSDPKGYAKMESALDAIATSSDLKLGQTLFSLAIDSGVNQVDDRQKALAARRWLDYFRRTQTIARLHSSPEELSNAIRGAFVCRLIIQSDDFVEAVKRSPNAAVGSEEDVSSLLERAVTTQVRVLNSALKELNPSTAMNKDIDRIKDRWYSLKAWHTESMKWLESVLADPSLMAEVNRIRNLSKEKSRDYKDIIPPIGKIEQTLASIEPRIIADRHGSRHQDLFKPIDFANLIIGQLVTLEKPTQKDQVVDDIAEDGIPAEENNRAKLTRDVANQLFLDIRDAVAEAGFEDLSKVTDFPQFPSVNRAYYQQASFASQSEDAATHELLLSHLKNAVAKAKGRIEAERITDLNVLEDLSLRASKADRIFFANDPNRYALLVDPSFLLHEWNNRHKIETIAEFRTVETRAQAQTQIYRYRKERERLEAERAKVSEQRQELETRLAQARRWADENDYDFNPNAVIDQMLVLENKVKDLQTEIAAFQRTEEKYREHHFELAEKLHYYRLNDAKFNRDKQKELLLTRADFSDARIKKVEEPEPALIKPSSSGKKAASSSRRTASPPQSSYSSRSSTSASPSSGGGFFQRLFGRRR